MKKKAMVISFILVLFTGVICGQSLTRIGFVVKTAVADGENFVVLCPKTEMASITQEAKKAQVINQRKYHVFPISQRSDIPRILPAVKKLSNPVVIIIADEHALSPKSVKYVAEKVGLKGIPVVTNRAGDTKQKALLVILEKEGKIVPHINMKMASILKVQIPDSLLAEAVVDIERP